MDRQQSLARTHIRWTLVAACGLMALLAGLVGICREGRRLLVTSYWLLATSYYPFMTLYATSDISVSLCFRLWPAASSSPKKLARTSLIG